MATTRYFASQSFADLTAALPQVTRFLINDHATITGPGWTIVEAYDGTTREIPSDVSDMDSFTGGFGWRNDSLGAGDWIVLESANANNTNHFQLYVELESTTVINFLMIPYEDFATGGGVSSPPLFPTSSFGVSSGTFVTMDGFTSQATYSAVADEGMVAWMNDNNTTSVDWLYVGELDAFHTTGTNPDNRCYVIYDAPSFVGHVDSNGDNRFNRLSPIDNVTVLVAGYSSIYYLNGPNSRIHNTSAPTGALGHSIVPAAVFFNDAGHSHMPGFLRNIFSAHEDLPEQSGTLDGMNYIFRSNQAEPQICMRWDGSTAYGQDISASLIQSPTFITSSASASFVNYGATVDRDNNVIFFFSGSTLFPYQTGSFSETTPTVPAVTGSVSGTNVDRHRLRTTYPSFRRKSRPAIITDE